MADYPDLRLSRPSIRLLAGDLKQRTVTSSGPDSPFPYFLNSNGNRMSWQQLLDEFQDQQQTIQAGGGKKATARQHEKGRLTARERITRLLDTPESWMEVGLWAAYQMYEDWGGAPSASVVCGVGRISGRDVMIIANDATTKAGAFFPMTCKKVLRAQRIAMHCRLPLLYLVDSAGV
ncbi:MAG: carboxyl transferase domain-containing protein, partial [Planctomycetota bacterium]